MSKLRPLIVFLMVIVALVGCATPAEPTLTAQPEQPAVESTEIPTIAPPELVPTPEPPEPEGEAYPPPLPPQEGYPAPEVPTQPSGYPAPTDNTPAAPAAVPFPSADETQLAGTYYAPLTASAPVVVLMHQFGSDQHQWDEIALWLQTGQPPAGSEWLPPLPEGMTFAVFTFDFRGHGESEGDANDDAGLLTDAQSALAFAKTQAGADPFRVITIGTSIGADGAVDACVALNEMAVAETQEHQGCLGAMAISPGSFLGVDYTNAATALLADPHLATVSCLAAEEDGDSPAACNAVTGERYQATIFPGNAHGTGLFDPGLALNLGDLILEFLTESLQLRQ